MLVILSDWKHEKFSMIFTVKQCKKKVSFYIVYVKFRFELCVTLVLFLFLLCSTMKRRSRTYVRHVRALSLEASSTGLLASPWIPRVQRSGPASSTEWVSHCFDPPRQRFKKKKSKWKIKCKILDVIICQSGTAEVELKKGNMIKITLDDAYIEKCSEETLWLDYKNITKVVEVGSKIYIDDGLISLQVKEIGKCRRGL